MPGSKTVAFCFSLIRFYLDEISNNQVWVSWYAKGVSIYDLCCYPCTVNVGLDAGGLLNAEKNIKNYPLINYSGLNSACRALLELGLICKNKNMVKGSSQHKIPPP